MDVAVALPPLAPVPTKLALLIREGGEGTADPKLQLRRLFTGPLFCLSSAAPSPCPKGGGGDLWWRALGDDDVNSETTLSLSVYGQAEEKQLSSTSQDDDNVAILSRKADQDPNVLEPIDQSLPPNANGRDGENEEVSRRRRGGGKEVQFWSEIRRIAVLH